MKSLPAVPLKSSNKKSKMIVWDLDESLYHHNNLTWLSYIVDKAHSHFSLLDDL